MTTHGIHGTCPYLKSSSAILSSLWRSASALILGQGEILLVNSRLEQPLKSPMLKGIEFVLQSQTIYEIEN